MPRETRLRRSHIPRPRDSTASTTAAGARSPTHRRRPRSRRQNSAPAPSGSNTSTRHAQDPGCWRNDARRDVRQSANRRRSRIATLTRVAFEQAQAAWTRCRQRVRIAVRARDFARPRVAPRQVDLPLRGDSWSTSMRRTQHTADRPSCLRCRTRGAARHGQRGYFASTTGDFRS